MLALTLLPPAALAADGAVDVSTGDELVAALQSLTDGSLTVNITNDIDAVTSATYTAYTSGASLTINGNGHTINGNGVNKTGLRFGGRSKRLNLTIRDAVFTNMPNSDRQGGGAVGLWNGELNVSGCVFTDNAATNGVGGAIRHQSGTTARITDSTFTGNSATGAGGALNIGVVGFLERVRVLNNTSPSVGGINGSASRALTLSDSSVYGNTLTNMANVVDGGGNILEEPKDPTHNLSITLAEDMSENLKKVFAVAADVNTNPVNLIEGTIYYDSAKYDVKARLTQELEGATVAIVNDDGAGRVRIVVGVKNDGALGHDAALTVAFVEVAPKAGQTPDRAYVQLGDVKAYSKGGAVDVTVNPNDALALFKYRSPSDANGDGDVTAADLSFVLYYFGSDNADADINKDGVVDMLDVTALIQVLYN
jgi:hypothetical protein